MKDNVIDVRHTDLLGLIIHITYVSSLKQTVVTSITSW